MVSVAAVALTAIVVTLAVFIQRLRKRRRAGMSFRSEHVIVFTRYPEPGTTKTRLIPDLGEAAAATLQLYLVSTVKLVNTTQDRIINKLSF